MHEGREHVLLCSSQEADWELATFLLLLLPYERSVAVLRRCCYLSSATVNIAVHLFAHAETTVAETTVSVGRHHDILGRGCSCICVLIGRA